MDTIKAIETTYHAVRFRSRLEARWAVVFDALGVKWFYEHEGYHTQHGLYVPDFWLPHVRMRSQEKPGILFEVKPASYEGQRHLALEEVADKLGVSAILAVDFMLDDYDGWETLYEVAPHWDAPMIIYACECGQVKFDYDEGSYYQCPRCGKQEQQTMNARVRLAYEQAKAYRFWGGAQ